MATAPLSSPLKRPSPALWTLQTIATTLAALTSLGMLGIGIFAFRQQQKELRELLKANSAMEEEIKSTLATATGQRPRKSSGVIRRNRQNGALRAHHKQGGFRVAGSIQEGVTEGEDGAAEDGFSRPDPNLADFSRLQREEFLADHSSASPSRLPRVGAPGDEDGWGANGSSYVRTTSYLSQEEGAASQAEQTPGVKGGREGVFRNPIASAVAANGRGSGTFGSPYVSGGGVGGAAASTAVAIPGSGRAKRPAEVLLNVQGTPSKNAYGSLKGQRAMQLLDEANLSLSPGTLVESEYARLIAPELNLTEEQQEVSAMLAEALQMRDRYLFKPAVAPNERDCGECATLKEVIGEDPCVWDASEAVAVQWHHEFVDGVVHVWEDATKENLLFAPPASPREFFGDFQALLKMTSSGPVKTFCHHRLLLLEQKYNLHLMLNSDKESSAMRQAPHRDFYNVRKVDTHVHHSAGMHQKHLLRFIKSKLKKEPDQVVIFRDGKYLTLAEVFESLNLSAYDLNIDLLDMHVDKSTFHRFDKFNSKYNPCGQSRLREIFIKQDNLLHGRFLAELTQEMFHDLEASKYQHAEYRISVYGRQQR